MTKNDIIRAIDTEELVGFSDSLAAHEDDARFVSLLLRSGTMRRRMTKVQLNGVLYRQEVRMGKREHLTNAEFDARMNELLYGAETDDERSKRLGALADEQIAAAKAVR